ncbi:MAG TPA: hypothetical protein VM802_24160 [Chitinophaga sp.]|uniref:hypothetical protein n=1 Tax=Chitinophaga sp. TaxID=1869181 RepID=UPI002BFD1271|nr:hypothetical protein [Chitinophaga sp.]HVI47984.1 hypothetical protein [Chitinophaga sp.]
MKTIFKTKTVITLAIVFLATAILMWFLTHSWLALSGYLLILVLYMFFYIRRRQPETTNNQPSAAGEQSVTNNSQFGVYSDTVNSLIQGINADCTLQRLDYNQTWQNDHIGTAQLVYCLSGHAIMQLQQGNKNEHVIVSPTAIVPLAPQTTFTITNQQPDPLILLNVQTKT